MSAAVSYAEEITIDCTWWNASERERDPAEILVGLMNTMKRRSGSLVENTKKCIAIFQWGGDCKQVSEDQDPLLEETVLAFNAAQNVVETVHAKVCKSRILPMALTQGGGPRGGGYLARHRAKQLSRAIEGEFDENNVDEIKEDVVMDALVTAHGSGVAKVIDGGDRVRIEFVPVEDVTFDAAETRYRRPTCCYHEQRVDKFRLLAEYGQDDPDLFGDVEKRRRAILKAGTEPNGARARTTDAEGEAHQVTVYEAWHLPSGGASDDEEQTAESEEGEPESKRRRKTDGRHVIAIDGCTLVDEPWDEDYFPFAFYTPRRRRRSVWGLSLMFGLVGPQREYEKLTKKCQSWHQKSALSGLIAPKTAKVNPREIQGGILGGGFIAEYEGQVPPQPFVVDPVPPGMYAYKESLPRDMMQSNGISSLSAQSQVPAGLQQASGKALQVFEDFEAERLLMYHRELERWTIQLSWLVVHTAKRIADRNGDYKVRYRGKRAVEQIAWKDVLADKEDFVLKVFPVSMLSKQPSAKFAQLQEMLNAGAITVEQFKRLYELPDLEAENELDTADTDIIDRNLDIIVTTGRYLSPEPFDNLQLIIERAGKFYNLCRQYDVPDDRLTLVSNFIIDAKALLDQQAANDAANAAAMGPPPVGPPPVGPMPGAPMPVDPMASGAPPMPPMPPGVPVAA